MKVVVIGSGSVATHLSIAIHNSAIEIVQIYSRTTQNAQILAEKVNASFTTEISEIYQFADFYIYALNDNSLSYFLSKFELPDAIHIHTAGSIPINIFEGYTGRYGVLYPLQTFSKEKNVIFNTIPVCVEGVNTSTEKMIVEFASRISTKIHIVKSEQRKRLHLAAVFACNFTNYMYDIANELVVKSGLNFEIIQPLIAETADKVRYLSPYDAQTGPAKRSDFHTIEKHIYQLSNYPEWKKIYKLLTKNIYIRHKKTTIHFSKLRMALKQLSTHFQVKTLK